MLRDTASRFADYALLAGEAFGDRVDKWITLNEPTTVTLNGYALGVHAPGATLMFGSLLSAHHQLLGHGLATQALRSVNVKGGIGITNVHSPVEPAKDNLKTRGYANVFDLVHNARCQREVDRVGQDARCVLGVNGFGDRSALTNTVSIGSGESRDVIFVAPAYDATTATAGGYNVYRLFDRTYGHAANSSSTGDGGQMTEIRVFPGGTLGAQALLTGERQNV